MINPFSISIKKPHRFHDAAYNLTKQISVLLQ